MLQNPAGHCSHPHITLRVGRLRIAAPIFAAPFLSNGAANLAAVMLLPHAPFYLVLEIPGWVSLQILDQYESIWIQAIQPDLGVSMGFTLWWIWTSSFRGSGEPLRT